MTDRKMPLEQYKNIGSSPDTEKKRKTYKIVGEVMEIRGECPFWTKGDKFEFDDCLKIEEKKKGKGALYGKTLKESSISSGLLCTYSLCQLHPIMVSMGRGGVGANELGLGNDPDTAYVACEAPAIGESPKGHGQVFFKLKRIPTKISQSDLFFNDLRRRGKAGGRYASESTIRDKKK
jgi:uncharacterized repeat protein (TIGR04076 family)